MQREPNRIAVDDFSESCLLFYTLETMETWKKIAVFTVCVATGAVVIVSINSLIESKSTTVRLKPGFDKVSRVIVVDPTKSERVSTPCYRYNRDKVEWFSNDAYGNEDKELTLILEKDFIVPITITVKATDLEPNKVTDLNPDGERHADPAIMIASSDGKFSTCYDYSYDTRPGEHGNEETLHTSDRNVNRRFEPKAGTYYIDLRSYHQPAKQYEVIISEDD